MRARIAETVKRRRPRTYEFSLILEGPDVNDPDNAEALLEATDGYALIGSTGGVQDAYYSMDAPSFPEAVAKAVAQIDGALPGLRVVGVDPDDLVTAKEIAERTGRSRQNINQLVKGQRGPGNFPRSVGGDKGKKAFWSWSEVLAWFADYTGEVPAEDVFIAEFTAMLNARLKEREHRRRIDEMAANQEVDAASRDVALATCAKIGAPS